MDQKLCRNHRSVEMKSIMDGRPLPSTDSKDFKLQNVIVARTPTTLTFCMKHMHHWEFPINEDTSPILTCPIELCTLRKSL